MRLPSYDALNPVSVHITPHAIDSMRERLPQLRHMTRQALRKTLYALALVAVPWGASYGADQLIIADNTDVSRVCDYASGDMVLVLRPEKDAWCIVTILTKDQAMANQQQTFGTARQGHRENHHSRKIEGRRLRRERELRARNSKKRV